MHHFWASLSYFTISPCAFSSRDAKTKMLQPGCPKFEIQLTLALSDPGKSTTYNWNCVFLQPFFILITFVQIPPWRSSMFLFSQFCRRKFTIRLKWQNTQHVNIRWFLGKIIHCCYSCFSHRTVFTSAIVVFLGRKCGFTRKIGFPCRQSKQLGWLWKRPHRRVQRC